MACPFQFQIDFQVCFCELIRIEGNEGKAIRTVVQSDAIGRNEVCFLYPGLELLAAVYFFPDRSERSTVIKSIKFPNCWKAVIE